MPLYERNDTIIVTARSAGSVRFRTPPAKRRFSYMGAVQSLEKATAGIKTPATIDFLKSSPKRLLINGKWVAAKSGKTFETVNPANEEVLALIAEGDKEDVDEAVKAAR